MKEYIYILLILCCLSCENALINERLPTDQASMFQLVWEDFDTNYAGFTVRDIDWDSTKTAAMLEIESGISEQAYFDLLSHTLVSLEDIHVEIVNSAGQKSSFNAINPNSVSHADIYLPYLTSLTKVNDVISYGKIKDENIGYIIIPSFSSQYSTLIFNQIDQAIESLGVIDGLIIDVRNNGGGEAANQKTVAKRFVKNTFVYTQIRFRDGPDHSDFDLPITDDITPNDGVTFTKPIVVLTNRSTASAAETFVMTLKTQDHITTVGDTTAGGLGLNVWRALPNGWNYRMTVTLNSNKDDVSFEYTGLSPDEVELLSEMDLTEGNDTQLEKAIELLK